MLAPSHLERKTLFAHAANLDDVTFSRFIIFWRELFNYSETPTLRVVPIVEQETQKKQARARFHPASRILAW